MADRYNVTKVLLVFIVRALAGKINEGRSAAEEVTINTLDPGLCQNAETASAWGAFGKAMFAVMKKFLARTTEVGGRTLVASAVGGVDTHGQYMASCAVFPPSSFVLSEEGHKTQERVYEELLDIVERIHPGIRENV